MSNIEISFLLVKPDGVSKGLVEEIRGIIKASDLNILEEIEKKIDKETAKNLYWEVGDIRFRDNFCELIEFMSSNPIYIFIVQGKEAVKKVRRIIGKRDSDFGIRRLWSEDIIHNVAHGPHTAQRAKEEIKILIGEDI